MESDLSHTQLDKDSNLLVDETVGSVQDQLKNIDFVNPEGNSGSGTIHKDAKEHSAVPFKSANHETLNSASLDISSKENIGGNLGESSTKEKEDVSKTVGIGDAEEGELDYEEEVPEEDRLNTDEQRVDNEDADLTDKDGDGDKNGEGSEEGEIVTDDDDDDDNIVCNGDKNEKFGHKDTKKSVKKDDAEEGEINDIVKSLHFATASRHLSRVVQDFSNEDLEEGQLDEELDRGPRPRVLCKYYEAGTCRWGTTCRFLHPGINDKGNYVMHRPVGMYPTAFGKPPPPSELGPLNNMILRGPPIIVTPAMQTSAHMDNVHLPFEMDMHSGAQSRKESAWERGLKKAKEIKLTSVKRKEEEENFEEKRLNMSVKESELESEWPTARRESWRHPLDRDNQTVSRPRAPEQRSDVSDRRFNRGRLSPVRRHEPERERPPRGHDVDREKPRDMDRERFLRMRRGRTPSPPDRKSRDRERDRERDRDRDRDRDRARDKENRRDKRTDKVNDKTILTPQDSYKNLKNSTETSQREVEKEAVESSKNEKNSIAPLVGNAEQWVDPWMRRQPQQNRSPEMRSPEDKPVADDNLSSIGSSDSEADSESEESDESGSDSDSESRDSGSDTNADGAPKTEVKKPEPSTKETNGNARDPRLGRENKDRPRSPQANKNIIRTSKDHRETDRRKYYGEPRRPQVRDNENERRHRDRRERYPPSPGSSWPGQMPMDGTWSRGGYHPSGGSFRPMPERMRKPEDEPRARMERHPGGRRPSPRSLRDSPHSRRHAHRTSPKEDKDKKRLERRRSQSPNRRRKSPNVMDPRLADTDRDRKHGDDDRIKDNEKTEKKSQLKDSVKRSEYQETKYSSEAPDGNKKTDTGNSDISEDEFKSPTYAGSGSDSASESGSDSESESEAASDSGSVSASGSESSASDSDSGSGSHDNSDSSDSDASGSRRKEIEKKKKDFKMVLSQTKNLSGSQRISKPSSTISKEVTGPKAAVGQKRPASGQDSSSSPRSGPNKTAARKDELLKELKAIEDAIARKRAKID